MGMYHSAYHFYGAHIPSEQWKEGHAWAEGERLGPIIARLGIGDDSIRLGHLAAGDYDRDMLFLVAGARDHRSVVPLGEFRLSSNADVSPMWNSALTLLAAAADYDTAELSIGWITVPDLS